MKKNNKVNEMWAQVEYKEKLPIVFFPKSHIQQLSQKSKHYTSTNQFLQGQEQPHEIDA